MSEPQIGHGEAESHIRVTGLAARRYDLLMNVGSLGSYPFFIRRAVRDMDVQPDDAILDLGMGTGRNSCLMARRLGPHGSIVGLDIGREMLTQARHRCARYPNVSVVEQSIEEELPYRECFDKAVICFVLHGLQQSRRLQVIENVRRALRPGGQFLILDYAEFEPERAPWPVRVAFRTIECPLAFDYVRRDWRAILGERGFGEFVRHHYYLGYVRLLRARKVSDSTLR